MDPVTTVRGNAIPLDRSNVDTDAIIPAKYLKRIERTGYGPFAFEAWREDPTFVLNSPAYQSAPILLAGDNFGCGSSREHAVWAIQQMGVQAVISSSFADIFRNNSAKMGLLTVVLPRPDVEYLLARAEELPDAEITIDLESQTVSTPDGWSRRFEIDAFIKKNLLQGLDDISLTLRHADEIDGFEATRPAFLPATAEGGS
jgi:3-isopropylmalate/(R)-2-methylmalate dehydratase small subunit